jgi:hypothetical protein
MSHEYVSNRPVWSPVFTCFRHLFSSLRSLVLPPEANSRDLQRQEPQRVELRRCYCVAIRIERHLRPGIVLHK